MEKTDASQMGGKTINGVPFGVIIDDYKANESVFTDDPPVILAINRLSPSDRNIIIVYAESGSVKKGAEVLGIHYVTFFRHVKRIREEIKKHLVCIG